MIARRPRLAVAVECALIPVGFCLDVLEHIGHFRRGFAEFCEDGQRAVDDGCAEYEARDEEESRLCECGHGLSDHAASGWGAHTVCTAALPDEADGWYGVCPCVRHGDDDADTEWVMRDAA